MQQQCNEIRRSVESMIEVKFIELRNFMNNLRDHVTQIEDRLQAFEKQQSRFEKKMEYRMQKMEEDQSSRYNDMVDMHNKHKTMVQDLNLKHENIMLRTGNLYELFSLREGEVRRLLHVKNMTPRESSLNTTDTETSLSTIAEHLSMQTDDVRKVGLLQQSPIFIALANQLSQKTNRNETTRIQNDIDNLEKEIQGVRNDLETKIDQAIADQTDEAISRHVIPLRTEVMSALKTKADTHEMKRELDAKASKEDLRDKADHHQMMRMYAQFHDDVKVNLSCGIFLNQTISRFLPHLLNSIYRINSKHWRNGPGT